MANTKNKKKTPIEFELGTYEFEKASLRKVLTGYEILLKTFKKGQIDYPYLNGGESFTYFG